MIRQDLIFDVGMHRGEDTEFYLKKGFQVVGVEANESLCCLVADRLADDVSNGRLQIVNKAISDKEGAVSFYINRKRSIWGTLQREWAERNGRLGAPSEEVVVEGMRPERLFKQFGVPYYLKIDIEGMDFACLESLTRISERPAYVSLESTKTSWSDLIREFDLLESLGYVRFKIVNQGLVSQQIPPTPALEGAAVSHTFVHGASGLFGEEAPGSWLSRREAIAAYKKIFRDYLLFGDDGLLTRTRLGRRITKAFGFKNYWYDTHAGR